MHIFNPKEPDMLPIAQFIADQVRVDPAGVRDRAASRRSRPEDAIDADQRWPGR